MRTTEFHDIDEAVNELAVVLANHMGGASLLWGYSKNEALGQVATHYVKTVDYILDNIIEISKVNISPIQFLKIAYRYSLASKKIKCDKEKISNNFLSLFNLAVKKQVQIEDYYNTMIIKHSFKECSSADCKLISYINAEIRALSELLYCDEHTIGGQSSGPYKYGKYSLLIHDFLRLCPFELFPQLGLFRIKRIISLCLYDDDTIVSDLYGNVTFSGNPLDTFKGYLIQITFVNNEIAYIDSDKLPWLLDYLDTLIRTINDEYHKMSDYDIWRWTLSCEYYALKPLLDSIHKKWWEFEDQELLSMYSSKKITEPRDDNKATSILEQMDLLEYSKQVIDPRVS